MDIQWDVAQHMVSPASRTEGEVMGSNKQRRKTARRKARQAGDKIFTLSRNPDVPGWETDSGFSGYGLSEDDAKELAAAANQAATSSDHRQEPIPLADLMLLSVCREESSAVKIYEAVLVWREARKVFEAKEEGRK